MVPVRIITGIDNIPETGGALIVSNHAGVLPIDGLMLRPAVYDRHPKQRVMRLLDAADPMTMFGLTDQVRDTIHQTPFKMLTTRPSGSARPRDRSWEPLYSHRVGTWSARLASTTIRPSPPSCRLLSGTSASRCGLRWFSLPRYVRRGRDLDDHCRIG